MDVARIVVERIMFSPSLITYRRYKIFVHMLSFVLVTLNQDQFWGKTKT